MYNDEEKRNYIEHKESQIIVAKGYLQSVFGRTAPFEIKLSKDVSEFTVYEIIDMYKILNYPSLDSLIVFNSILSLYTQYCVSKGCVKDNQNHFLEISNDMLNGCVNKVIHKLRYVDFQQIKSWCKELPNPCDQFVLMGLFSGIKGKDFCEIVQATMDSFKTETSFITCTKRNLNTPKELFDIALEASESTHYFSMTGNMSKEIPFKVYDKHIVKNYPNVKDDTNSFYQGRRMYSKIVRIFDLLGIKEYMNANSIVESGMLEFVKTELDKRNCSLNALLKDSDFCATVKLQYDKKIVVSNFVREYGMFFE